MTPSSQRVAVITGANGGLGLEVARRLVDAGMVVVIAARNQAKAQLARDALVAQRPDARVEVRSVDLASLASVRDCARSIANDHDRIDILVNNAGVMGLPASTTEDGFETQFGVNHLGHFVFTGRLLPLLLATPSSRVVTVTSFARWIARPVRERDMYLHRSYGPWRAYGRAKLSNLLFAAELNRRLRAVGADTVSVAAHPGLSHTDLQTTSVAASDGGFTQRFWDVAARAVGASAANAARPIVSAATNASVRGGELFGPLWVTFGPPVRRSILRPTVAAGAGLWRMSEQATSERIDVETLHRNA